MSCIKTNCKSGGNIVSLDTQFFCVSLLPSKRDMPGPSLFDTCCYIFIYTSNITEVSWEVSILE